MIITYECIHSGETKKLRRNSENAISGRGEKKAVIYFCRGFKVIATSFNSIKNPIANTIDNFISHLTTIQYIRGSSLSEGFPRTYCTPL